MRDRVTDGQRGANSWALVPLQQRLKQCAGERYTCQRNSCALPRAHFATAGGLLAAAFVVC